MIIEQNFLTHTDRIEGSSNIVRSFFIAVMAEVAVSSELVSVFFSVNGKI